MLHEFQFVFEKADVELRVVNHKFGTRNELQQLVYDLGKTRCRFEIRTTNPMYSFGTLVDVAFWV